ncbi:MAG: NUDIX domain-containing protein [Deltaproteobacteria bacterium]|nr:NUDIX domain-containing protein [Deltaproteobacteria bacterium]
MAEKNIRVITLGIVRHPDGSILLDTTTDPKRNLSFLRPLGGGVDFSESCEDAIAREFKEEISADVRDCTLLSVFENIFEYNGEPGHEIVFFYELTLSERSFYERAEIPVREGAEVRIARWYPREDLKTKVIFPPQILKFL